jgi:hypothetical protein
MEVSRSFSFTFPLSHLPPSNFSTFPLSHQKKSRTSGTAGYRASLAQRRPVEEQHKASEPGVPAACSAEMGGLAF